MSTESRENAELEIWKTVGYFIKPQSPHNQSNLVVAQGYSKPRDDGTLHKFILLENDQGLILDPMDKRIGWNDELAEDKCGGANARMSYLRGQFNSVYSGY